VNLNVIVELWFMVEPVSYTRIGNAMIAEDYRISLSWVGFTGVSPNFIVEGPCFRGGNRFLLGISSCPRVYISCLTAWSVYHALCLLLVHPLPPPSDSSMFVWSTLQINNISKQNFLSIFWKKIRVAVMSAKKHKRQRRKRQSVNAKREKSQTTKFLTAILPLPNLT